MTCDFTRAPQKRGPSKGYLSDKDALPFGTVLLILCGRYIKELAERVHQLEYKTGAAPPELQYQPMIHEEASSAYAGPSPNEFGTRKRTYDAFDGPSPYDNTYNSLQSAQLEFDPRHQVSGFLRMVTKSKVIVHALGVGHSSHADYQ